MQVQYDGTAYLGFASQDLEETVENHLFNALIKLKLIEDRKVRYACNFRPVPAFNKPCFYLVHHRAASIADVAERTKA